MKTHLIWFKFSLAPDKISEFGRSWEGESLYQIYFKLEAQGFMDLSKLLPATPSVSVRHVGTLWRQRDP